MRLLTGFELFTGLLRIDVDVFFNAANLIFNFFLINAAILDNSILLRRALDFLVGVPIYI